MPVVAILRETIRKNMLPEFFFVELADNLSVALADVDDHALAYCSSTALVYRIVEFPRSGEGLDELAKCSP